MKKITIILLILIVPAIVGVSRPATASSQTWRALVLLGSGTELIDQNYDDTANYFSAYLRSKSVQVDQINSCNESGCSGKGTGWSVVGPILKDYDIIAYFGHGLGNDTDYQTLDSYAWGLYLDNDYTYHDQKIQYGEIGQSVLINSNLKPNCLIYMGGACFSAGSSSTDPSQGVSEETAHKRVDAYADTFLKYNGAQAYLAGGDGQSMFDNMFDGKTLQRAMEMDLTAPLQPQYFVYPYDGRPGLELTHAGFVYQGRQYWPDAYVGNPGLTMSDVLPGYQPPAPGPSSGVTELSQSNPSPSENFEEFLLLENPNGSPVEAVCYLMTDRGETFKVTRQVAAYSRDTVWLNQYLPGTNISAAVKTTGGEKIIAERSMYFVSSGRNGGSNSFGSPSPAEDWYLAEGYTGGSFDSWILVQNPSTDPRHIDVTLFNSRGESYSAASLDMAPSSRYTLHVDDVPGFSDAEFSSRVHSPGGVIAERAVYFNYGVIDGGHTEHGATSLANTWYFAEGYTAEAFDTYVLVWNPNDAPAHVDIDLMNASGGAGRVSRDVPAHARSTFKLDDVPGFGACEVSSIVKADRPVVAERSMYFDYKGKTDGSCVQGVAVPGDTWDFAEGCSAQSYGTYILLQNPGDTTVDATLDFMKSGGGSFQKVVSVPPRSRKTVFVNEIPEMANTSFSTHISCSGPLVCERAMYFDERGKNGGHASAGVKAGSSTWYFAEGYTGN